MILSCIEELDSYNTKKFSNLLIDKMKVFSEFLISTVLNF